MTKQFFKKTALASSIMASVMMTSLSAQAFDFKFGSADDAVEFEWNNHLTYGAMYRTQDPNKAGTEPVQYGSPIQYIPDFSTGSLVWVDLAGRGYNPNYSYADTAQAGRIANSNDGNLNMDGLVQNRISVLSELAMNWKNFGAFVRGRAWYDDVYKNGEPEGWDPALTGTSNSPNYTAQNEFHPDTVDYLGSEAEILDAFVYTSFRMGSMPSSLKVGKQVINWGESMAFSNSINSAINPVDANSGTRAGIDLKEIFMPTESVYFQVGLTPKISIQTFYQWKHRATELLPTGSFFSETDMLGAGGEMMFAGPNLVANVDTRDDVKDGGQYGLAFTYFSDSGAEYGLYAVNAHDKAPSLQVKGAGPNTAYHTWYAEDREVYAASFSTVWGETNLSGELSYRPNAPIVLDANCVDTAGQLGPLAAAYPDQAALAAVTCTDHAPAEVVDASYTQAQVSFTHVGGGTAMWDQITTAGEVVGWYYDSIDKKGIDATDDDMYATNTANGLGTLLRVGFDYYNVFAGANLSVPVTWQYGWTGTNSRSNTREGASILSVGASLLFPNNIETSLVFTQYDGESKDQADPTFYHLEDRDNVAFSAKYSF